MTDCEKTIRLAEKVMGWKHCQDHVDEDLPVFKLPAEEAAGRIRDCYFYNFAPFLNWEHAGLLLDALTGKWRLTRDADRLPKYDCTVQRDGGSFITVAAATGPEAIAEAVYQMIADTGKWALPAPAKPVEAACG